MRVERISLDLIIPSPFNVRQNVDADSLIRSIDSVGQIEPLRVIYVGDRFEIRTGMRRYLALKQVGTTHADAIVVEGTDEEVINEQWTKNEERADYTDYERALKLRQMMDALGLTQAELAERIGKDPSWVSRHIAMLKLKELPMGKLSELNERQAQAILQAPEMEMDWPALVQYVELHSEEMGKIPPGLRYRGVRPRPGPHQREREEPPALPLRNRGGGRRMRTSCGKNCKAPMAVQPLSIISKEASLF